MNTNPPPHVDAESPLEFGPMLLRLSTEETLIPKGMSGNKHLLQPRCQNNEHLDKRNLSGHAVEGTS